MGDEYNFDSFHEICFAKGIQIFTPTAESRPYSPAMQQQLTVWFDRSENYLDEGLDDDEDEEGTEKSIVTILRLINAMEADFDHIFVGGFSQGGSLALHSLRKASTLCPKVRGVFTMGSYLVNKSAVMRKSTAAMMSEENDAKGMFNSSRAAAMNKASMAGKLQYPPQDLTQQAKSDGGGQDGGAFYEANSALAKELSQEIKRKNTAIAFAADGSVVKPDDADASTPLVDLPVLMMHGEQDELISAEWGKTTATDLLLRGVDVRFESYAGLDHEIGEQQLKDALLWMEDIVLVRESEEEEEATRMALDGSHARGGGGESATLSYDQERERALGKLGVNSQRVQARLEKREANVVASVSTTTSSSKKVQPAAVGGRAQDYSLEVSPTDRNVTVIHYPANPSVVDILAARPVLACGGMFDIQKEREGCGRTGVFTEVTFCADPDKIAHEIGLRLSKRLESEGASLNACPMA
jgi:predicted esterase